MEKTTTIIKPVSAFALNTRELWQHRELLYFFSWRDIKVKYKQTALGVLWVVLQPLAMMLLFTLVFSKTSIAQKSGAPYSLYILSGLIVWNLFNTAVSHAADSMTENANIIKKIYFPRLLIPLSTIFTALLDFCIALLLFFIFCIIFQQHIDASAVVYFPAGILVSMVAAFGFGTLLGALNVKYRDFRYALPFLLQVGFFSTQIIYPATLVQQPLLKYLFALNPMNAAVELFHLPISHKPPDVMLISIGTFAAIFIAILGLYYFKKTEIYFADII